MNFGSLFANARRRVSSLFALLLGDVIYALLPILAILFVIQAFHFDLPHGILYLPEWSFASIVFLGLSIKTGPELDHKAS
jgi:hypothetical protein